MKIWEGPVLKSYAFPNLPKSELPVAVDQPIFSQQFDLSQLAYNQELGFSSAQLPYRIFDKQGNLIAAGNTNP